jgi:hypothetical protein
VGTHMDEVNSSTASPTAKNIGHAGSKHSRRRKARAAAAGHTAKLNPVQKVIDDLRQQLDSNEAARVKGIEADIKLRPGNTAELQSLKARRPNRVGIIPVSCVGNLEGFDVLTERILQLSTPTLENPHPFQLVNIEIPNYYMEVKDEVEAMIRDDHVATMQHLHDKMSERKSYDVSVKRSIKHTRDAVTFLSSVGEVSPSYFVATFNNYLLCSVQVVWFGAASRFFGKDAAARIREISDSTVSNGGGDSKHHTTGHVVAPDDMGSDHDETQSAGSHQHSHLAYSPAKSGEVGLLSSLLGECVDICIPDDLASIDTDANRSGGSNLHSDHWDGLSEANLSRVSCTWKDVDGDGQSDSDVELPISGQTPPRPPMIKRRTVPPSSIIDDLIFLSPHWLLLAMKRVLTHHLAGDLEDIM